MIYASSGRLTSGGDEMFKKAIALMLAISMFSPIAIFANSELIVGGDTIGIEVDYDGVMVTGTYTIPIGNEIYDPSSVFQKGDIIKSANGSPIHSLDDLYSVMSTFQNDINDISVEVDRNGSIVALNLKIVLDQSASTYKSGLYVKDKIVGVGTMTYYDPSNQTYGALGHEIMDTDLHRIADINHGSIYASNVTSITKSQAQAAGEKHASIDFNKELGTINKNTAIGIYGKYHDESASTLQLEWANKEDIVIGPAKIYTVLNGSIIESFDIEITKIHMQNESAIKGIEYTVTDPILLEQTNGIIQGMSGSPIVQNNKMIGAVTHVILENPLQGYGVFIEWMLQESDNVK